MHGSHVMLEAIKQAREFGLDMVTLPFHTSHALQILDVNFFKPFKKKNLIMQWLETIIVNQTNAHLLTRWIRF